MKTGTLTLVAAIVLLAGGAYYWYGMRPAYDTGPVDSGTSTAGMRIEDNTVVMYEQQPGSAVQAALVYLANPGFLVIEEDADGSAGATLGVSGLLPAGERTDLSIPLARATSDGETLHASLYADTDGNGMYDPAADKPVDSVLGGPIQATFLISKDAEPPQGII
jgi:hypothetical protein